MNDTARAKSDTVPVDGSADKRPKKSKALTIVGIVMCVILVPILVINITMVVQGLTNPDKVPSIFGYSPLMVLTGSMEDTIMENDLIVIQSATADDVQVNDIISFYDPESKTNAVLTHRCIEIIEENGVKSFKTKGDANGTPDLVPVPAENIIGKFQFRLPGIGRVAYWMQTTPGLIICIAVPIIILVGYDLIMKKRFDKKKKKDTDALLAELEALRAQAAAKDGQAAAKPSAPAPVVASSQDAAEEKPPIKAESAAEKSDMASIDALINEITNEDNSR